MKALCAWGYGVDAVLREGSESYDLTLDEARKLRVELDAAIAQCEELEKICEEHDQEVDHV